MLAARRMQPNEVMELLYTSGTTGEPKGALHTSNTHFANLKQLVQRFKLTGDHVFFMPSPLAHQTGFGLGMEMALMQGSKLVLQDVWEGEVGLQRIQDEGANFMIASTPFLTDLIDCPNFPNTMCRPSRCSFQVERPFRVLWCPARLSVCRPPYFRPGE